MLGPLPRLYRILVVLAATATFVAAGAWAASVLPYPVLVSVGASIGLAVGAVLAFLLVRESSEPASRPARVHPPRRPRRR